MAASLIIVSVFSFVHTIHYALFFGGRHEKKHQINRHWDFCGRICDSSVVLFADFGSCLCTGGAFDGSRYTLFLLVGGAYENSCFLSRKIVKKRFVGFY